MRSLLALTLALVSTLAISAPRPTSVNFTQGSVTRSLIVPASTPAKDVQYTETLIAASGLCKFSIGGSYVQFSAPCDTVTRDWVYPVICPPPAATETQAVLCSISNPSTPIGSWTQTRTHTMGPSPQCVDTPGPWLPASAPAGACTAAPPPTTGVVQVTPTFKALPDADGDFSYSPAAAFHAQNMVAVVVGVYGANATATVTVNGAPTQLAISGTNDGFTEAVYYGRAGSGSGGVHVVYSPLPYSGGAYVVSAAVEMDDVTGLDVAARATGSSAAPAVTLNGLDGNNRVVTVFGGGNNTNVGLNYAPDTKILQDTDGGNSVPVTSAYRAVANPGSATIAWTAGGSVQWQMLGVAFNTNTTPPPPQNQPPVANFTFTTSGLTASFTDASTDDSGVVSRSWNFGDNATSAATNPSHTYASAGTYAVTQTVTDAAGLQNQRMQSVTVSNVAPPPTGTLAFNYTPDQSSAAFQRWKDVVDSGDHDDMSAIDAAFMYKFTGNDTYRQTAIRLADAQVTAYEQACGLSAAKTAVVAPTLSEVRKARIREQAGLDPRALNRPAVVQACSPEVAGDSYLYAGDLLSDVIATYALANPSASQKQRWAAYINQVVYNVWNPNTASFGGQPASWSGWSINDPLNNYFYRSFVRLSMLWAVTANPTAIVKDGKTLRQYLDSDRIPLLVNAYATYPGGGSPEGYGYGQSHQELFELYKWWDDSTGQDLTNAHMRNSIYYWLYGLIPDWSHMWPVGSQARISSAPFNDYPLNVVQLAYFQTTDAAARNAACWLFNHARDEEGQPYLLMHGRFMSRFDTIGSRVCSATPPALTFRAAEVGGMYARTAWEDAQACWVGFLAGDYSQSHAHAEQLGVSYACGPGGWLTVTNNMNSNSGIHGEAGDGRSRDNNVVAFYDSNGNEIRQKYGVATVPTYQPNPTTGELHAVADGFPISGAGVNAWKRSVDAFAGNKAVLVTDNILLASGVTAKQQWNVNVTPTIVGNGVSAGHLRVTVLSPANPTISVVNLSDGDYYATTRRIDIVCPNGGCQSKLEYVP